MQSFPPLPNALPHLSLNSEGRLGTTDDFTTSFPQFSLFSTDHTNNTALFPPPNPNVRIKILIRPLVYLQQIQNVRFKILLITNNTAVFLRPRELTFTWWGCCSLCFWYKPTELAHSFYSVLVSFSLLWPFHLYFIP